MKPTLKPPADVSSALGLLAKIWPYLLLGLALVVLVVLVWLFIRWRRQRASLGAERPAKGLPQLPLKDIWRAFIGGIPREYRNSLVLYQPFILFGGAGSGKSCLIDRCVDWQGQLARFYPSYTADPLIQIYIGTNEVVQEISTVLLGDISPRARQALVKLWKPLRRGKEPKVVVVLDAVGLQRDPPDVLLKHAQLIRGKIDILSRLMRRPVRTVITLTHMDQLEGFVEFAEFLQTRETPLSFEFLFQDQLEQIAAILTPFEGCLPAALIEKSPAAYLKILAFMQHGPELLCKVHDFTKSLQEPDPASPAPEIVSLHLTGALEAKGAATNPLIAAITNEDVAHFRPLRRHQLAAAALALGGALYFGGSYLHERSIITAAASQVERLTEPAPAVYPPVLRQQFFNFLADHRGRLLPALLPRYYAADADFLRKRIYDNYITSLRQRVLYPLLQPEGKLGPRQRQRQVLYCLALLYGSQHNRLGQLILNDLSQWEEVLDLPEELIRDYLNYSRSSVGLILPVNLRKFDRTVQFPDSAEYEDEALFFSELSAALKAPSITVEKLDQLRTKAQSMLAEVQTLDQHLRLLEILQLLQTEAQIKLGASWLKRLTQLPKIDPAAMQGLVTTLKSANLVLPEVAQLQLGTLISYLKQIAAERDTQGSEQHFSINNQDLVFKSAQWHELIKRSRLQLLLKGFIAQKGGNYLDVFFPAKTSYDNQLMNPYRNGESFFPGDGQINGLFTRKAFDEQIKSALTGLPEVLKGLSLQPEDNKEFTEFVTQNLEDYAQRYLEESRSYFRAFKYRVPSAAALQFILDQLQLPTSPLKGFLNDVEHNTALELEANNPFFEPMQKVTSAFAFLSNILVTPKGGVSGLEQYAALLAKLKADLASKEPFVPANQNDETNALNSKLSALGRVALAIFRDTDDSYLKQVEAWQASANIKADWQGPFSGPVLKAYALGSTELSQVAADNWESLNREHISPLAAVFPFKAQAEAEAALDAVERALHPQKAFWTTFQSYLAPLCLKQQGRWMRRATRVSSIPLPAEMLPLVNTMAGLSAKLWDGQGNPQPLVVQVKPMPLSQNKIGDYVMVLAYLQLGADTVFAFNQQPRWTELKINWWKAETASVGAAFARQGQSKKSYRNTTVGESFWSFYRLLQQASGDVPQGSRWQWRLTTPGARKVSTTVQFQTKDNPWAIYQALKQGVSQAEGGQHAQL